MNKKIPKNEIVEKFIINDFIDDFMQYYAVALMESDRHPEQANNEVRNAFVHIGRFLKEENSEDNLIKAKDHLERAKRDCMKLAIIDKKKSLNQYIKNIEFYNKVSLIEQRYELLFTVSRSRIKVFMNETRGLPVSDELAGIYKQLRDMEDYLSGKYGEKEAYKTKKFFYRFFIRLFNFFIKSFGYVFSAAVSAYILALVFPNGTIYTTTKKVLTDILSYIN